MYHYAGNNPINYTDPDGRADEINYTIIRPHGNEKEGNYWSEYIERNEISESFDISLYSAFNTEINSIYAKLDKKNPAAKEFKQAFDTESQFLAVLSLVGISCPEIDFLIVLLTPVLNANVNKQANEWNKLILKVGDFTNKIKELSGINIGMSNLQDYEKLNKFVRNFKLTQKNDKITVNVQNQGKYSYNLETIEISANILNVETGEWEYHAFSWEYASNYSDEY